MKIFNKIIGISLLVTSMLSSATVLASNVVYVATNKADGNTIAAFTRSNGQYSLLSEYPTGGLGTGDLEIPALKKDPTHPLANGDDPLISAYGVLATSDNSHLIVVNPGDASVSLLKVKDDHSLSFVNKVKSSDRFPISVAINANNHVVVASVGNTNNEGSIQAYRIRDGRLTAVDGSRRDLKARPSTVAFNSNGEILIVNELVTGKIKTFGLSGDDLTAEPISVIDSPRAKEERFQAIPVGFDVREGKNGDTIFMSEARFLTPEFGLREEANVVVQSPKYSWQTGSLSSYRLTSDGKLSLISGDVLTGTSIEGGEIANCWVELSTDGKMLWAVNALSSSISSFDVDESGNVNLKNVTAYKNKSETLFFSDLMSAPDGKHLFQLIGNKGEIAVFKIAKNGDLQLLQTVGGMPQLGTYGLVVM